jgi:molecular chaperone GrpE
MSTEEQNDNQNIDEQSVDEAVETAAEAPDFQALYQRSLADLENMRKRFGDERKLLSKLAIGDLVIELLPVLDNFTRATEHVPADQKDSPWSTGILYIRKQLMDVLGNRGVSEVLARVGDTFDPEMHEAIGTVVDNDKPEDAVAEVKSHGYKLNDRIIRPVQVIVVTHESKE